jgi:hypothetical protein
MSTTKGQLTVVTSGQAQKRADSAEVKGGGHPPPGETQFEISNFKSIIRQKEAPCPMSHVPQIQLLFID